MLTDEAFDPCRGRYGHLRQADETDEVLAYLPLAWVGDHFFSYAQGIVAGFCITCPESRDTVMADRREIGPTFYFAPPRTLRDAAHARDDPHGGRRRHQAQAVPLLHRRGAALRRDDPQRQAGAADAAGCSTGSAMSWSTRRSRTARLLARARRLYRGRGDRAGSLPFLPLARLQPEAALRPDRSLPLRDRAARRRDLLRYGRAGRPRRRDPHLRERRGACSSRPACSQATSRTRPRPPRP